MLVSAVFCEIMVTIKVSNGSAFGLTSLGKAKVSCSVFKIVAARVEPCLYLAFSNGKVLRNYWFARAINAILKSSRKLKWKQSMVTVHSTIYLFICRLMISLFRF